MVMTVKYLSDEEKPESRELWEEAFPEDSKSFDDYYFREKIKDNRILAITESSQARTVRAVNTENPPAPRRLENWWIDAMIHQNPYRLQVGIYQWNVDYLVGVATRCQKRRRGYMTMLLTKLLRDAKTEQMPFCFLMPKDEAIYRPFGFVYIFRQPHWEWRPGILQKLKKRPLLPWADTDGNFGRLVEAAQWVNRWLGERYQVFALRDREYMYRLLQEIASEDGELDMYYDGDEIAGICGSWGLKEKEQRLLYADDAYVRVVGEPKPAIMARIVTPEVFMEAVHLKEAFGDQVLDIRIRIKDPLIEENNRTWLWHLGQHSSRMEKVYENLTVRVSEREVPDLDLTVTELTEWLFGGEAPPQAAGYVELIEPLGRVFLDEVV